MFGQMTSWSPVYLPTFIQISRETLGILDKQIEVDKKKIPEFHWDTQNRRHILIVSSWRTGSSFFGHVLAQYPAIFHVHEPLMYVGVRQIRTVADDETLATEAIRNIRDILLCRLIDLIWNLLSGDFNEIL
jgi:hypothetical protein